MSWSKHRWYIQSRTTEYHSLQYTQLPTDSLLWQHNHYSTLQKYIQFCHEVSHNIRILIKQKVTKCHCGKIVINNRIIIFIGILKSL